MVNSRASDRASLHDAGRSGADHLAKAYDFPTASARHEHVAHRLGSGSVRAADRPTLHQGMRPKRVRAPTQLWTVSARKGPARAREGQGSILAFFDPGRRPSGGSVLLLFSPSRVAAAPALVVGRGVVGRGSIDGREPQSTHAML